METYLFYPEEVVAVWDAFGYGNLELGFPYFFITRISGVPFTLEASKLKKTISKCPNGSLFLTSVWPCDTGRSNGGLILRDFEPDVSRAVKFGSGHTIGSFGHVEAQGTWMICGRA